MIRLTVVAAPCVREGPALPFGQKLASLRKERGLTQQQLAERMGVPRSDVDYYERRAKNPSVETIEKVAAALGVAPALFLDGAKAPRKKPGPPSLLEERIIEARRLPRRASRSCSRA